MRIIVKNFCALKNIDFALNPGINVLAGKNGSGKSQLLMALAHQYGNRTLNMNGFENIQAKTVTIEPKPQKVLWRQPIRNVGSGTRGQKYATLAPPSYATRSDYLGYTWNVDERYNNLHNSLTNMYVAGNLVNSSQEDRDNWIKLTASFQRMFGKDFTGEYTSRAGRVGIKFDGEICRFDTLSTGELEFLSLFSDILTEPDVDLFIIDEIDAHFHPNLQKSLLAELGLVSHGRNILLTTHSPSLMLSVPPENLFYIRHHGEVAPDENQVTCLIQDVKLLNSISEMYSGFISDIRIVNHYLQSINHELLIYAEQCLADSVALGVERASDSDPQTSVLRGILLARPDDIVVQEIGVGKGRLMAAFGGLGEQQLSRISYVGIDIDENNLDELDRYAESIGLKNKFKSFTVTTRVDTTNSANLCILANVIHEIGPDQLAPFLAQVFASLEDGGHILLLEALELAVGEKRFVAFDEPALREILKNNLQATNLTANFSKVSSHGGTPLLEAVITLRNKQNFIPIQSSDIMAGLKVIINNLSDALSPTLDGLEPMRARALAFNCHNLANACAYLKKMHPEITPADAVGDAELTLPEPTIGESRLTAAP